MHSAIYLLHPQLLLRFAGHVRFIGCVRGVGRVRGVDCTRGVDCIRGVVQFAMQGAPQHLRRAQSLSGRMFVCGVSMSSACALSTASYGEPSELARSMAAATTVSSRRMRVRIRVSCFASVR